MSLEMLGRRRVCDSCHSRKVRCDRNDPCGNCLDQGSTCTRSRGMKRLPKRDLTRRARSRDPHSLSIATTPSASASACGRSRLQSVVDANHLLNFNLPAATAAPLDNSFIADILDDPIMLLDVGTGYELHGWMAIVPLTDAQMINRRRRVAHSSSDSNSTSQHLAPWGRSQVLLESALSVASQVLGSMEYFTDSVGMGASEEQRNLPSIEFLYWMLKDIGSTKFGPFISDYFRHISNQTLKHMGLSLLFNTASHPDSILYTVCVNSVAYKFLTATLATETDSELAQSLRASALLYRETAKAALQKIPLTAKPSLALLQAILCGIFLSQGIGDTNACRELARTACRVAMDIGIVPGAGVLGDGNGMGRGGLSEEEYYCFMWCYTLDRNYAWKFGGPRILLVDPATNVDPPAAASASQLMRIYLDLAKVQDAMIPFLDDPGKARGDESFECGKFLLSRMERVKRDIDSIKPRSPDWHGLDTTSEIATLDFAYHSILTNLLHLRQISLGHATSLSTATATATGTGTDSTQLPASTQTETAIYLDSARRNLLALITICASTDEQTTVAYLHWTILYYPITACIALFCNAIATGHEGDVEILRAVSNSLAQSGMLSAPIAAMRRLLVEFVKLSRGVFPSTDDHYGGVDENGGAPPGNHGIGNGPGALSMLGQDPVPRSIPESPWLGGSASQEVLGMGMGMGLHVSSLGQQVEEGMATTAGFNFMDNEDLVFSF
ncbi:hypothetical protein BJX63DRAFT_236061 [Aspergillus granulosus]|uniref:Zn(2)-C6 fungal-type domain-containing protein n=1 Tax=Aspergillus granulosus TaxID=176169 RepID=A0ABR4HBK3_9EURO